jgi:hypothetical protein
MALFKILSTQIWKHVWKKDVNGFKSDMMIWRVKWWYEGQGWYDDDDMKVTCKPEDPVWYVKPAVPHWSRLWYLQTTFALKMAAAKQYSAAKQCGAAKQCSAGLKQILNHREPKRVRATHFEEKFILIWNSHTSDFKYFSSHHNKMQKSEKWLQTGGELQRKTYQHFTLLAWETALHFVALHFVSLRITSSGTSKFENKL